jgi:hypothetical protein
MKNHTGMGNAIRNTQSYNNNIDYNDNGNNNNENENGNENGNGNEHPDLSSNRIDETDVLGKSPSFDEDDESNIEQIRKDNIHDENDENTQRKILKRTYKIGKSISNRKISVLVSNKTLRHQASNKSITLKKTPMNDVRKFLVKRGLVKVGTTAPPDVLRKMYESASMVCGDITNHNPETLMYNFLNPEKKSW